MLEWDKLNLATATFRSLSLYRNGAKAGNIPFQPGGRREVVLSTKISGLAVDTEYSFHLVLRTSAGTYSSDRLSVRTHKMTDLTGITVTPGILPPQLSDSLVTAVDRIGGKIADTVRIDTTHFVCTEGRGKEWERATEMNIPVVRPEWVEGCEREGRIVGVRGYYLDADPRHRQVGQGVGRAAPPPQQQQQLPQRAPPESTDRRDMAPPAPDQHDRNSRTTTTNVNANQPSGSTLPLASPPPPTPAKDERIDPTNKEVSSGRPTTAAAAATAATATTTAAAVSEDAETESDDEPAATAGHSRSGNKRSANESEEVSPVEESEDKTSNALGISGISRKTRPQVANAREEEDDEDDDEEEEDGDGAKSPGNFSEVQL